MQLPNEHAERANYLTTTGASFFAAHTKATIHPITLQPRKKFSRKIASRSRLLRASAMIEGRKYITVPKPMPKNGKKKNVDKIMATSHKQPSTSGCPLATALLQDTQFNATRFRSYPRCCA